MQRQEDQTKYNENGAPRSVLSHASPVDVKFYCVFGKALIELIYCLEW